MLMSDKSMSTAMNHIKPFFQSGKVKRKGTFVLGTVAGDLHDIGKNLASAREYPGCIVGLSAMFTATMINMFAIVERLKKDAPGLKVIIGGLP